MPMQSSSRIILIILFLFGVTLVMMDCARRSAKHKHPHSATAAMTGPARP